MRTRMMLSNRSKSCWTRSWLLPVAVLLLTFLVSPPVDGATYYVATDGNDFDPGTENQPWLTIQHASDTMVAGDSVFIRAGVYNEHVSTMSSGNISDHIVYSAYPGETPIIDGTGVTESQNGIIVDRSYIKLLGLELRNWNDNGIWIQNAAYVEISDCEVHDVTFGIGVASGTHDFEFNRTETHNFDFYGFDVSPAGGADCYNGTFNDCVSHTGRDPQQNVDGFALGHGDQYDFVFNRCETYDVYDGFDISSRNTTLNRCSAHDTWNGGYKIWEDSVTLVNCIGYHNSIVNLELDWDGESGTTTLWNCTFMDAQVFNIAIEDTADHLEMYNCILAGGDNIGLLFGQTGVNNYSGDHNLFHNDNQYRAIVVGYEDEFTLGQVDSGAWMTYSGQDSNSLAAYSSTGLFVDPANYDLHLLETSPAVDHGTSNGAPSEDYDGNPRPQGGGYDIGAYEYGLVGIGGDELSNPIPFNYNLFQNYPNPFNPMTTIEVLIPEHLSGKTTLIVYDIRGRKIRTLIDSELKPGRHSIAWDGRNDEGGRVPSGIYLCTMRHGGRAYTRKMNLLK